MPDSGYESHWADMRMKHLELIQSVIARMGNNSASLKNYCMTLAAGVIGLAAAVQKPEVLLFSIPIILVFSILDTNYLRLERAFRDQYEDTRKRDIDCQPDFLISPNWSASNNWLKIFFSWSVFGFFFPIMSIMVAINYAM